MIKFFRKIRQRLLTENKLSKYLIYAIGEILLVMIVILLALQVNNWNEKNKKKEIQLTQLSDLKIEIKSMQEFLKFHTNVLETSIKGNEALLELMRPDATLTISPDSIHRLLATTLNTDLITAERLTFETQVDFEPIQKQKHTLLINNLINWKHFAGRISADYSLIEANREEDMKNALIKLGIPSWWIFFDKPNEVKFPVDYELLIRNNEIYAVLIYRYKRSQFLINDLKVGLTQLDEMLSEIK
jgi:hypothetical protein